MIPWQTYYNLNRHLPYGKIMEGYNRILQEFNETLNQTMLSPTSNVSSVAGGTCPLIFLGNITTTTTLSASYSSTVVATNGFAPYTYSLQSGTLPAGTSLNASTGVISGVITNDDEYTFVISVKDKNGTTSEKTYTVTVTPATITVTGNAPVGLYGSPYTASFTGSGGVAPYTYSLASGTIPAGTSLSANGRLSGSALTNEATYTFTIRAIDSAAHPETGSAQFTVLVSASVTVNTSSYVDAGVVSASYSSSVSGSGGKAPYTYSITSGSLPDGLTLNSGSGLISGTPEVANEFSFIIKAVDSGSYSGSAELLLTVTE